MALTVTNVVNGSAGSMRLVKADLGFDSAYPYGGYTFDPYTSFGLVTQAGIFIESRNGNTFQYDSTTKKVRAFAPPAVPPIIYEEKITAAANLAVTRYPAAFILNITKAGANQAMRSTGIAAASLNANECCLTVQMQAGKKTQITTQGATDVIYVSYVTQTWQDVWNNVIQDEVVTLSSSAATNLANDICAVMYIDQTDATAAKLEILDQDDAAASGKVLLTFGSKTGAIGISNAAQNSKACKITYLRRPASGFLLDRAFSNETATKAGAGPYTNTFSWPILLWGYSGVVPVNGGVTQKIIEYSGTPGAGNVVLDWFSYGQRNAGAPVNGTTVGGASSVTCTGAGIKGTIDEIIWPSIIEVFDGTDLSTFTSRVIAFGW